MQEGGDNALAVDDDRDELALVELGGSRARAIKQVEANANEQKLGFILSDRKQQDKTNMYVVLFKPTMNRHNRQLFLFHLRISGEC